MNMNYDVGLMTRPRLCVCFWSPQCAQPGMSILTRSESAGVRAVSGSGLEIAVVSTKTVG